MTRPILRFEGNDLARRMGAVFAENVHDLVEKVDMEPGGYEAGFFHTSTVRHPNTCYYDSVWSRDAGRGLIELSRLGFQREAEAAAGYLLRNLNKGDHWGRTTSPNDSCGYEADGNALVLLGIANVWKMSGDKEKLGAEYLKAAEPVVKWLEHEMRGNPLGCLLPCISELSGNPSTPYTVTAVFPNYALKMALEGLLEMARAYRFSFGKKMRYLYLPSLLPYFAAACGTGIGIGWKAGIAAEVLGLPKNSIGKALYNAKIYLEMPDLFCWTAVIILLSLLFEKLAALLLRVLTARLAVEKEGQR